MAAKQRTKQQTTRLLGGALLMLAVALIFYFVAGGHVYRATQGASLGFYVSIGMLMAGFAASSAACLLALSVLLRRPRGTLEVVDSGHGRTEKPRKAA